MQVHPRIIWGTTLVGLTMGSLWSAAAGILDRYAKEPDVQTCINREEAAEVRIEACTRFIKSLADAGTLTQIERGLAYVKSGQIYDAAADYYATRQAAQCRGPALQHRLPYEIRQARDELKKAIHSHPKV